MSKLTARCVLPCVIAASALALTGCGSSSKYPGHSKVAGNLTPDMMGLYTRPIDKNNNYTLSTNETWRMFWDDLGRVSLLDRPSRLTPVPLAH